LEQTGSIDNERVVNGAPGSPRTPVCHAVISRNAARGARPEAAQRRGERKKRTNMTTP